MLAQTFAGYFPRLDALTPSQKDKLTGLVFCNRAGQDSVTIVTKDLTCISSIVGSSAAAHLEDGAKKYGVDLESVGTDTLRLYADYRQQGVELIGYYINSDGSVSQTKTYNKISSDETAIERRDTSGVLLGTEDGEVKCDKSEWTGPSVLSDRAEASGLTHWYTRKTTKDQTYLVVFK